VIVARNEQSRHELGMPFSRDQRLQTQIVLAAWQRWELVTRINASGPAMLYADQERRSGVGGEEEPERRTARRRANATPITETRN
jgi:hypothetical protein